MEGQVVPPVGVGVLPHEEGHQVLPPVLPPANGKPGNGPPVPNRAPNVALDWDAEQARVALYLANAIAQENNQASLYCPSRDYHHLLVCPYGQVSTQIKKTDLNIKTNTINYRGTVPGRPPVATYIVTGPKVLLCYRLQA